MVINSLHQIYSTTVEKQIPRGENVLEKFFCGFFSSRFEVYETNGVKTMVD